VDPGFHFKFKGKILNLVGVAYAISAFSVLMFITPLMVLSAALCDITGERNRRRPVDWLVHLWANISINLVGFRPRLIGKENLPVCSLPIVGHPLNFVCVLTTQYVNSETW
jgi:hypothetical protein